MRGLRRPRSEELFSPAKDPSPLSVTDVLGRGGRLRPRLHERWPMRFSFKISASSLSSRRALPASLRACAVRRTSIKTASAPAATPADASGSMLGQACRYTLASARQLQTVCHVEDNGIAELLEHRQSTHVHHQIVIPETRPTLCNENRSVALCRHFGDGVAHVGRGQNWPFLILTGLPVRAAATSRSV